MRLPRSSGSSATHAWHPETHTAGRSRGECISESEAVEEATLPPASPAIFTDLCQAKPPRRDVLLGPLAAPVGCSDCLRGWGEKALASRLEGGTVVLLDSLKLPRCSPAPADTPIRHG